MTAADAVGARSGPEVEAAARLRLVDGRLTWASAPPVVLRRTGHRRVHVVAVGGGPLGGDRLRLRIELGAGERLAVHSAAATVVQPGREPGSTASFEVEAEVAEEAALDWQPEPTVICDGARWRPTVRLDLADGARARVVEQLVLGRSGQVGGRCDSTIRATVAGAPLLATTTLVDGADPAVSGIGGTGGARSVGSVLLAGDPAPEAEESGDDHESVWARTPLAGPGSLLTAVGTTRGVAEILVREGGVQRPWW